MSGNYDHLGGGGVRPLMEKTILNFHFDHLTPSLNCFTLFDTFLLFLFVKTLMSVIIFLRVVTFSIKLAISKVLFVTKQFYLFFHLIKLGPVPPSERRT